MPTPQPGSPRSGNRPSPPRLGEILEQIVRREGLGKKPLQGRRLARKVLNERLGPELSAHADVLSVRTGVVVVAADSSALFQELEGFRRQELLEAFRAAGLKAREVRVQLAKERV